MKLKNWCKVLLASVFAAAMGLAIVRPGACEDAVAETQRHWKEYRARHFFIYYQSAPYDFVLTVGKQAEGFYEEIFKNLGVPPDERWSFDERASIYIYDDAADYQASVKSEWSHGMAFARERIIRTFPMAHGFFDSTLPHELTHIIFRRYIGFDTNIPTWFEEGVAMYQEQAKRYGAHQFVKQAIAGNAFLTLPQMTELRLTNTTPVAQVELYYWESASFMIFLVREMGEQRFLSFLRDLQNSHSFEKSLASVYVRFKNVDDLNKAWTDYLRKL